MFMTEVKGDGMRRARCTFKTAPAHVLDLALANGTAVVRTEHHGTLSREIRQWIPHSVFAGIVVKIYHQVREIVAREFTGG